MLLNLTVGAHKRGTEGQTKTKIHDKNEKQFTNIVNIANTCRPTLKNISLKLQSLLVNTLIFRREKKVKRKCYESKTNG